MTSPHRTPVSLQKDRTARIVWAPHILRYLTNTQSHEPLGEAQNSVEYGSDADEFSDSETDHKTDRNAILSGPRDSVRQKYLDLIAELLSPCRGWNGVTATAIREGDDGVEVDVARNDGFVSDKGRSDAEIMGFCRSLEGYLVDSAGGMPTAIN